MALQCWNKSYHEQMPNHPKKIQKGKVGSKENREVLKGRVAKRIIKFTAKVDWDIAKVPHKNRTTSRRPKVQKNNPSSQAVLVSNLCFQEWKQQTNGFRFGPKFDMSRIACLKAQTAEGFPKAWVSLILTWSSVFKDFRFCALVSKQPCTWDNDCWSYIYIYILYT